MTADCKEPALDILASNHGLWTAHSGVKEHHEEKRAEEKNGQLLTTTSIPFMQLGAGLWKDFLNRVLLISLTAFYIDNNLPLSVDVNFLSKSVVGFEWWADIRDNYQVLINLRNLDIFYNCDQALRPRSSSWIANPFSSCHRRQSWVLEITREEEDTIFPSSSTMKKQMFCFQNKIKILEIKYSKSFRTFIKTWNLKLFKAGVYVFGLKSRDFV
ncbi:uncharacterized protein LOC135306542 isoform X2 [Passer domesticus]|uniref:uncharacterized protein LOC135306542 isoform X2 n=1 Tax=Passer domesticus TaxID=48849 RepID=UPI0030FE7763